MFNRALLAILLATTSLLAPAQAEAPLTQAPAPATIAESIREHLPAARACTVALKLGGLATGVVISEDGLLLTAGHVMQDWDFAKPIDVVFADGTTTKAKPIGSDIEADLALLQLEGPGPWKTATLPPDTATSDESAPDVGSPVFFIGYPGGQDALPFLQVRTGRVLTLSKKGDRTDVLTADCPIQPGDSGGPLFDLKGRLVGIGSTAHEDIRLNRFVWVGQYSAHREKFLKGGKSGDPAKGPESENGTSFVVTPEITTDLTKELAELLQAQHRPTIRFAMEKSKNGKLEIDPEELAGLFLVDFLALSKKQPRSRGIDDPAVIKQLPKLPADAISLAYVLIDDMDQAKAQTKTKTNANADAKAKGKTEATTAAKKVLAMPVDEHHFLAKASEISTKPNPKLPVQIAHDKKRLPASILGRDEARDLLLIKTAKPHGLAPYPLTPPAKNTAQGDLLHTRDPMGLTLWGLAAHESCDVMKKTSRGPMLDKTKASERRAEFRSVITHTLQLDAADAGTPIFDEQNNLVGMHIARYSRTLGLIMPTAELALAFEELKNQKPLLEVKAGNTQSTASIPK